MVSCRNVSVSYEGFSAVEDVTFDVLAGDYLCVVGENGSGKSSLMKSILGLIKPTSGRVTFDGLGPAEIGYLPQRTNVQQDFPASVHEVVISGRAGRHGPFAFYSRSDRARVDENLERLGIADLRRKSYRDLSGGQRQRALLARALCAAERLVMLDEPVAGLDPMMASEMYDILEGLNRDGMTIVMISHDMKGALRYGNRILHMRKKVLFFGASDEYVGTDAYRLLNAEGGE
ncbi:MAG: ABC transporter ATP-binding protein [Synergistaceae bacterium]|jgi:zinc transport system ATP-binding protein|nr:ABC transporter ATP-binding protein [Synergistaceae bacterium]